MTALLTAKGTASEEFREGRVGEILRDGVVLLVRDC
jgi:hypothetical protein